MGLIYEPFNVLTDQAKAELRRQISSIDPTVFGSFASPFLTSASALAYSITLTVRDLEVQLFPQTANGEFLELWGGYEGLERLPASSSIGDISIGGTVGVVVPVSTVFNGANGVSYTSTAVGTVQTIAQSITTVSRVGSTVTVTTTGAHTLATGLSVTIAGAVETEYNGTFDITVTARNQFTYTITTTPTTPATGTITLSSDYAIVSLQSDDTGQTVNLNSGAVLTIDSAITNLDSTGFVQFDRLSGGANLETDAAYRARILLSRSIQEGVFTADQIKLAALGIAGNTRVFVVRASASACSTPVVGFVPSAGEVAVYVLRDNAANIIPSQAILDQTKQAIIDNGKLPANTYEGDLYVFGPNTVEVDFDFTALSPDTPTMRTAVEDQLNAFFEDSVDFEEDVLEAAYLGAIQSTQDLQTGDFINSFALSAPSGDVAISAGEIGVLGSVTFSI